MLVIVLLYFILGAVSGILAGLFGIGGGVVLVPSFIVLFEWQKTFPEELITHMAVATSLACIVFSSLSAMWSHHQKRAVMWEVVVRLTPGIVLGSALGVWFASLLPALHLKGLIAFFLIVIAFKMLKKIDFNMNEVRSTPSFYSVFVSGSLIGCLSAVFGIGGGSLTVPYLQHLRIVMQKAVATSAACGFPIAFISTLVNIFMHRTHGNLPDYALGYVYLPALLGVVCVNMVGAKIGVFFAHQIDAQALKKYFAYFLLVVGVYLSQDVFFNFLSNIL
jgi:uncharacterized protein